MTKDTKIEVIIDSRNFTVVGGENEEYVRGLAYYVDKKIRDLNSKNSRLSQQMVAILAALNIADEFHQTKEELKVLENKAKDPLEKYEEVCDELNEAKEKIGKFEKNNEELEKRTKIWKDREKNLLEEIKNLKTNNKSLEEKIQESEEELKTLQDKNFKNQVELVELKKELGEYIRLLEKETSTLNREGN